MTHAPTQQQPTKTGPLEYEAEPRFTRSYRAIGEKSIVVNEEERSIEFVASTPTEDSYGEILEQSWDLTRYKKNPIVLYEHGHPAGWLGGKAKDGDPIGKAPDTRVENGVLKTKVFFIPPELDEGRAERIYQLLKACFLNCVSVGFRAKNVRQETRDGKDVWVLSDLELYEISVVRIPANPDAVALQRTKSFQLSLAAKPASSTMERNMNELELLAKRLGVEAVPNAVFSVAEKHATIYQTAVEALGLDAKAATAGDVAKKINELTAKAAEADRLAPIVTTLKAEVQKSNDDQAAREVSWLIKCGTEGVLGVKADEKSRKALMAYRKADPTGFSEDYKPALDALVKFDNLSDYKSLVEPGAQLAPAAPESNARSANDEEHDPDSLEAVIADIQRKHKQTTGKELSRAAAIELLDQE